MQLARIALLTIGVALAAGTASAGPKPKAGPDPKIVAKAKPHVTAADTAYKLGKFADALAEYSKAYEIYAAPALLFNIGQCQRNLKDYEKAIFSYEAYLRANPQAPNRSLVEDLIKESKAALAKQNEENAAALERDRAAAEAAAAAKKKEEFDARREADEAARQRAEAERQKLDMARRAHAEANKHDDHFYKKWWFWTGVATVAAAAGGTVYYFSGDTTYIDPMGTLGNLDRR